MPLYAVSILFVLLSGPLWLLWWTNRKLPEPGPDRPRIDVIIPAYNEAENIPRLLRSIDIAAGRYGGPVNVLVSERRVHGRHRADRAWPRSRTSGMRAGGS